MDGASFSPCLVEDNKGGIISMPPYYWLCPVTWLEQADYGKKVSPLLCFNGCNWPALADYVIRSLSHCNSFYAERTWPCHVLNGTHLGTMPCTDTWLAPVICEGYNQGYQIYTCFLANARDVFNFCFLFIGQWGPIPIIKQIA